MLRILQNIGSILKNEINKINDNSYENIIDNK